MVLMTCMGEEGEGLKSKTDDKMLTMLEQLGPGAYLPRKP